MKFKGLLTVATAFSLATASTMAAAAPVAAAAPQPVAGQISDGSELHGEGFIVFLLALAAVIAGAVVAARGGGKPLQPVSP